MVKILLTQVDSNLSKKAGIIKSLDTNRLKMDTIGNKKDSTKSVQILRVSKDSIDAPVNYNATDSGVMIMATKEFFYMEMQKQTMERLNLRQQILCMTNKHKTFGPMGQRILRVVL